MSHNRQHIITPTKVQGTPDLMVEILPHSTESRDRRIKRTRDQTPGVPEYWIVDPFAQKVEQLVLKVGVCQPLPPSEELQLTIFENVTMRLDEVW